MVPEGFLCPVIFFLESLKHVLFKMVRLIIQLQIFVMPEFFKVASQRQILHHELKK